MKIDVIIPAYEGLDTIDRALASVAMQILDDGDSFKVTIVNDCSPKADYSDTVRYWSQLMDIQCINRETNGGVGQARQTGIDGTDGDCFTILDVDDVFGSPFALRILAGKIKEGMDLAMGMFVEETPIGTFVNHGENYVWMHGKMYRREFIKRIGLRFNETRYNEDVGYNSVARVMTEKKVYIPQVVHLWLNRKDSTVRNDDSGYRLDYGWRQFVENVTWAENEMTKREAEMSEKIRFVSTVLVRLYWNLNESVRAFTDHAEMNTEAVQRFYDGAAKWYVMNGYIDYDFLCSTYAMMAKDEVFTEIPLFTFDSFLEKLGFFRDEEEYNNGNDSTGSI